MKNLLLGALSLAALSFIACEKDETDEGNDYAFINQNLQGKVAGADWEYQSGRSREDFFNNFSNDLRETPDSNICSASNSAQGNFILFGGEPTVGLFELGSTKTVTFVTDGNNNLVATQGAYEILSVDTVSAIVTGRMDVTYDGDNSVNGNFSITYCKE
jgi:hypothetical protein